MSIFDNLLEDYWQINTQRQEWKLFVTIEDQADFNQPGYYPLLSWDPSTLCNIGSFKLWASDMDGELLTLLVPDMREIQTYQIKEGDGS